MCLRKFFIILLGTSTKSGIASSVEIDDIIEVELRLGGDVASGAPSSEPSEEPSELPSEVPSEELSESLSEEPSEELSESLSEEPSESTSADTRPLGTEVLVSFLGTSKFPNAEDARTFVLSSNCEATLLYRSSISVVLLNSEC
jgi:hypothetical protein